MSVKCSVDWCKNQVVNVHSTFSDMIDLYFDTNDSEWMPNVLYQLMNCCIYFLNASVVCEEGLIEVLLHYIKRQMMELNAQMHGRYIEADKYVQTLKDFKYALILAKPMCFDLTFLRPRKRRRIK
eukprot:334574_1